MKKKISFVAAIFVLGILVAGFVGYVATKEAFRNKKIEQEIEGLKQQAAQMRTENNRLQEKIAYFDTPEFKEKVAKEKLNLQKPDEQVVVIKPSPKRDVAEAQPVETAVAQEQEMQKPNYQKWWDYFFTYKSQT